MLLIKIRIKGTESIHIPGLQQFNQFFGGFLSEKIIL